KFLHTESLKVHLSNSRTPLYPYSWEIYLLTAFVIFSSRIQVENYILDKKEITNQSGHLEQLKNTLNHYIVQEAYQSVNA
ncbi:hypothetical protein, partial [Weizmannia agrestimuris]|uniref:hypothetical protein n=1 Tax=Weizmannia agrestimuris TaxID=2941342 RepID=UPI00203D42A7